MPTPKIKDVIKEAVAQKPTSETTAPPANNPLGSARERLRVETKRFAAGGIIQGVQEIMEGDFSGIEEELTVTVDEIVSGINSPKFSGRAIAPTSSTLFALKPAD